MHMPEKTPQPYEGRLSKFAAGAGDDEDGFSPVDL
jgi:hypothetical protein